MGPATALRPRLRLRGRCVHTFRLEAEPDVSRARTPPGAFYNPGDAAFRAQREALLARSWQFAPDLCEVPAPGDVRPFSLLRGALDEPLLATRDERGVLRALSNACTHRGAEIVTVGSEQARKHVEPQLRLEPQPERVLRCGYHGRRFGLDGRCRGAPGFASLAESDNLRAAEIHLCRGALPFVNLDPRASFETEFGDLMQRLAMLPLERLVLDPAGTRSFTVRANSHLYVENYLEGLHVPFVHPALSKQLTMSAYSVELFGRSSLQVGAARDSDEALLPGGVKGSAFEADRVAAFYAFLFPNTMLNFYPFGLSANVVAPLSATETRVDYFRFVWPGAFAMPPPGGGAGGDLNTVELEDDAIVESVQRGLGARLYSRGRYAPRFEAGTHHYHQLLSQALSSK